jgi:hypothetical protein
MSESTFPTLLGVPIENLHLNSDGVPVFLPVICSYVVRERQAVGVFRLCGDHSFVQELGVCLNFPNVSVPPSGSIHDVASFLKLWLRSLPEPLLTPAVVNEYFVPEDPSSVDALLRNLNPINRKSLAMVLATMQIVVDMSHLNQMTFLNLIICFNTSLLQNNKNLTPNFKFTQFFTRCIELMNPDGTDFIL